MQYVEQYGMLWKLTDAKYKKMLKMVALGETYDLDELGKHLGIVHQTLNLDSDEAAYELAQLTKS